MSRKHWYDRAHSACRLLRFEIENGAVHRVRILMSDVELREHLLALPLEELCRTHPNPPNPHDVLHTRLERAASLREAPPAGASAGSAIAAAPAVAAPVSPPEAASAPASVAAPAAELAASPPAIAVATGASGKNAATRVKRTRGKRRWWFRRSGVTRARQAEDKHTYDGLHPHRMRLVVVLSPLGLAVAYDLPNCHRSAAATAAESSVRSQAVAQMLLAQEGLG